MLKLPRLELADLVFVRGSGWISRLLLRFQARGTKKADINHVAGVVYPRENLPYLIIEANPKGVELRKLDRYATKEFQVAIYRARNISPAQKQQIVSGAMQRVGTLYGYLTLAQHLLDQVLFRGKVVARKLKLPGMDICSEIWAEEYSRLGYSFGILAHAAEPQDMYRYVLDNPDKYEAIMPLGRLELVK